MMLLNLLFVPVVKAAVEACTVGNVGAGACDTFQEGQEGATITEGTAFFQSARAGIYLDKLNIDKVGAHKKDVSASLASMAQQIARFEDSPTINQDDLSAVTALREMLEQKFEAELITQSDDDQVAYNARRARHEACIEHKDKRMQADLGDVPRAVARSNEAKEKHRKCRKLEKALQTFQSTAEKVGSGTWATMVGSDMPEVAELCTSKDEFDRDKNDYEGAVPAGASTSCGIDQGRYEEHHCEWITLKVTACVAFDECIAAVDLSTQKAEIESRIQNRKDVYIFIQELKCRLDHMFEIFNGSNATGHDCDKEYSPPSYNLSLPIPSVVRCSTDADISPPALLYPANDGSKCQAWIHDQYAFGTSYTTVNACVETCTIPASSSPSNPDLERNCQDTDSNICGFYGRHWSACGQYDSDQATTHCCACGGGNTTTSSEVCPSGSVQVGGWNADIEGCGLQACDKRYDLHTIEDCALRCLGNENCMSYTWAPLGGDKYHVDKTVCTIYDTASPDRQWGPNQIMCKPEAL